SRKDAKAQRLFGYQLRIALRSPITEELPRVPHFAYQIEIQIGNDDGILIAGRLSNNLSPGIAEVTLTVKLTDVPGLFMANTIDCTDKISIRHRMRGLLELPEIFRQPGDGRRRIEHNLCSVQSQGASAFR